MELTEFPVALVRIEISDLSLIGNNIPSLPDQYNADTPGYFKLSLGNNSLTSLPERIRNLNNLQIVALENSQLQELPAWIYKVEKHTLKIYLHGTPFCNSKSSEERATRYGTTAVLTCADTNLQENGRYPYELTRAFQVP